MPNTAELLYNSTITSAAISAAFELGLFDLLAKTTVSIDQYCIDKNLDRKTFIALIFSLQGFNIIRVEDDTLYQGAEFNEIYVNKGYFHWMVKGYGDFLVNFSKLLRQVPKSDSFYYRDGAAIALSGKDYGAQFVDAHVNELINELSIKKIADLGCGSANRLIEIVRKKECQGVGVEINTDSVRIAESAVIQAGCAEHIQIVQGDVSQLEEKDEFKDVSMITSFFMGHDLWPRQRCIDIFRKFLKVFPNTRYFLLCDTYRSDLPPQKEMPIFTLGFELFHSLMRQYIPSIQEWRELFIPAGWKLEREVATSIPFTTIFLLTPHKVKV